MRKMRKDKAKSSRRQISKSKRQFQARGTDCINLQNTKKQCSPDFKALTYFLIAKGDELA